MLSTSQEIEPDLLDLFEFLRSVALHVDLPCAAQLHHELSEGVAVNRGRQQFVLIEYFLKSASKLLVELLQDNFLGVLAGKFLRRILSSILVRIWICLPQGR